MNDHFKTCLLTNYGSFMREGVLGASSAIAPEVQVTYIEIFWSIHLSPMLQWWYTHLNILAYDNLQVPKSCRYAWFYKCTESLELKYWIGATGGRDNLLWQAIFLIFFYKLKLYKWSTKKYPAEWQFLTIACYCLNLADKHLGWHSQEWLSLSCTEIEISLITSALFPKELFHPLSKIEQ